MSGNTFTSGISRHVREAKYRHQQGGRILLPRSGIGESGPAVDFDSQCQPSLGVRP